MSLNNISKNDENFLKDFLKRFYRQIINLENYIKYINYLDKKDLISVFSIKFSSDLFDKLIYKEKRILIFLVKLNYIKYL